VEQFNTSISSARALGGIGGSSAGDHDHNGHDHSHHDHSGHNHNMATETTSQPETLNDEGIDTSIVSDEIGDATMYGMYHTHIVNMNLLCKLLNQF
jgi:hypothetical protein